MEYQSTRGKVSGLNFKEAVMMGLALDGGLLVPQSIPDVSNQLLNWRGLDYQDLAFAIMRLYMNDIADDVLKSLINKSYATFDDPLVTPVNPVGDIHVLELFHGPTLAFKDVALQFLGNLFEVILEDEDSHLNILGATSGDTGSAAIAGVRGKDRIKIFILYPEGKTSLLQERQMTTVLDDNIHNIALQGSFDDCQTLMKSVFSDLDFKRKNRLGAVNSVNWARVLAQIVYYFHAWYQLGCPEKFNVSVPTGNFGNIFSGFVAKRMGLPIHRLILATNSNDILARFFNSGRYRPGDVQFSESPAMDIQVASNFERYLFYKLGQSGSRVTEFMDEFVRKRSVKINYNTRKLDADFITASATDEETIKTIKKYHEQYDYLVDPHTAVGIHVASNNQKICTALHTDNIPLLCLSTAYPAKFEKAMNLALPGVEVTHPALAGLLDLPERKEIMPVDEAAVRQYLVEHT